MGADEREWTLTTRGTVTLVGPAGMVPLRPRERAVLAALSVAHPQPTSIERLIALVWGDSPPASARKSLQNHIARIRSVAEAVVHTADGGYRLDASVSIDHDTGDDAAAPLDDLADSVEADAARRRLTSSTRAGHADRLRRVLADGIDAAGVVELERLVRADDTDESAWEMLARGLAQVGRRREALAAIAGARSAAADAGLPLGQALRDLDRRLLDDDPSLRTVGASGRGPYSQSAFGHLVGLDAYIEAIDDLGHAGPTKVFVLTGSAGIGKTTLAEQLIARSVQAGAACFVAACTPEPSVPLEPFADVLHQIAERFPASLAAVADAGVLRTLAPSLPIEVAAPLSAADRSVLFGAIGQALRCAGRPTMVVFEDLHWATPLTVQLLQACVSVTSSETPLMIVCTSRQESPELLDLATLHLPLQTWTLDGVRDYLTQFALADDWTEAAAAWVHHQSGGNALHVRELAMAAIDAGSSTGAEFVAPDARPDSLSASLERTLRLLTPRARRDLDGAAVLGSRFRRDEWLAMISDEHASVDEAIEADIIVTTDEPGVIEFRHDLLHAIVLDAVSAGRRVELHDAAFGAIAATADGLAAVPLQRRGELSRHAVGAATLDRLRAVDQLVAAAEIDTDRFAYEAAADKYAAALQLLVATETARRAAITMRLGQMLLRVGDSSALDHLLGAARTAVELGDEQLMAMALREACRLGPTSVVGAVHDEARELLEQALAVVTEPQADAMVATAGVMLYAISGEYDRCRAFFDRAACYVGDDATRVDALSLAVLALNDVGDFERRVSIEAELSELAARTGSVDAAWGAAHLRMTNQMQFGDPAMRGTLAELETLTRDLRQRTRQWEYTNWTAAVALISGDPDLAEVHATSALECLDAVAESLVMSAYGAQLLAIRMAQGRVAELAETVAAIIAEGGAIGAWHAVLALASAADGDEAVASEQLAIVIADDLAVLDRDYTFNGALCAAGEAAVLLGDEDAANTIIGHLRPWSGMWTFVGTCTMGPVDLTLARLAGFLGWTDDASLWARRALDQARRVEAPLYAAEASALLD